MAGEEILLRIIPDVNALGTGNIEVGFDGAKGARVWLPELSTPLVGQKTAFEPSLKL